MPAIENAVALLALLLTVSSAACVPGALGLKVTRTVHLPFGGIGPTQLVVLEKSEPFSMMVPLLNVTVAPPFLAAVLVNVTTLVLLEPTLTLPKFTEAGEIFTTAATVGVGVAVGVGVVVGAGVVVGVGLEVAVDVGVGPPPTDAYALTKVFMSTVPQPLTSS